MKATDRLIIEEYNEKQRNFIKNKIGIQPRQISHQYGARATKWLLPSKISLGVSIILLMLSSALFILNGALQRNPETEYSAAEKHLGFNTMEYIKSPIKTILVDEKDLVIALYYGTSGITQDEGLNYLLFEINTSEALAIQTTIESSGVPIRNSEFIFNGQTNNFYTFELDEDLIEVLITIDEVYLEFTLDLEQCYQFVINKNK
ncbi:MAG TPA: hypothetical protein DD618_02110 [Acholeplasmatales bacterium]|nr:hypothetical protein [Acholeplasmatales bacterium]